MKSGLWLITLGCFTLLPLPSYAQIIPDNSLGTENSQINSNAIINGNPATQIEGGATRGSNLFHSFQDFNVNLGQQVYFANPADIANIFTRVTGNNPSNILGTLGVDGAANLFLLNPNGIIFGENAQLDIRGSFVASTADSILFNNGVEFSATNPQAPPLLTINVPLGLQRGNNNATITNRGNLSVGGDFTLDATNLNLQNQIHARGNLTFKATDTLTIRDTESNPFLATAYGALLVQGNQTVDIFALNHADSGFYSYGNMTFRSDNPVGGDAHYWSGGNFRIERLDGSVGDLYSPYDPVILAEGDVTLGNYRGASIHILAGGSVTTGDIKIDDVGDPNSTLNPNHVNPFLRSLASFNLSDGTPVTVRGDSEPTVDIRAGIDWNQLGGLPAALQNTVVIPPGGVAPPLPFNNATNASIRVGKVELLLNAPNPGQVILTNRFYPQTSLATVSSNISTDLIDTRDFSVSGSIYIDSRYTTALNAGINASAYDPSDTDTYIGNGGDVRILSRGTLTTGAEILTRGLAGGNVTVFSLSPLALAYGIDNNNYATIPGLTGGNINVATLGDFYLYNDAKLSTSSFGSTPAGNVNVLARNIIIEDTTNNDKDTGIFTNTIGTGNAGDINLNANSIRLAQGGGLFANTFRETRPFAQKQSPPNPLGNAGSVTFNTGYLSVTDGSLVSVASQSEGRAGFIGINADLVDVVGTDQRGVPSAFVFGAFNSGRAGVMQINANNLRVKDGALISGSAGDRVIGNLTQAGLLDINARDFIIVSGSGRNAPSSIVLETSGLANAGSMNLATRNLFILDGGNVSGQTISFGNAGTLNVIADNVLVDGTSNDNRFQSRLFFASSSFGSAGNLNISTQRLQVSNGGIVSALTAGSGSGGTLNINASESVIVDGKNSDLATGLFFNSLGSGNAGGIRIDTQDFKILNNGQVTVSSRGTGAAGNLQVFTNSMVLNNNARLRATNTAGAGSIRAVVREDIKIQNQSEISVSGTGSGVSGNLDISAHSIFLNNQGNIRATTESGQGGDINLSVAKDVRLRFNSNIETEARGIGDGGNITINAGGFVIGVLGENSDVVANAFTGSGGRVQVNATGVFGFRQFRDRRTPESDLIASSELGIDGIVELIVRDLQLETQLPDQPLDPNMNIGCQSPRSSMSQRYAPGSLTITGTGGVRSTAADPLNSSAVQVPWATSYPDESSGNNLAEAQGLIKLPDGEVILTSQHQAISVYTLNCQNQ